MLRHGASVLDVQLCVYVHTHAQLCTPRSTLCTVLVIYCVLDVLDLQHYNTIVLVEPGIPRYRLQPYGLV
jgi:hypothetical protein